MPNIAVVGLQWGDEGKGAVVDRLVHNSIEAGNGTAVVRYSGGANAGHTVEFDDKRIALHLLPCGVLHPDVISLIGNGVYVNFDRLHDETRALATLGITVLPKNLGISERAHIVTPYHILLELAEEIARSRGAPEKALGTTLQGIGPTAQTKAGRLGLRVIDVLDQDNTLEDKLCDLRNQLLARTEAIISSSELTQRLQDDQTHRMAVGLVPYLNPNYSGIGNVIDHNAVFSALRAHGKHFERNITDVADILSTMTRSGDPTVIYEGAQGAMLDIDCGTYPYVTSSSTTVCGISNGVGMPIRIDGIIGVLKAYTTRVGAGKMPTECTDARGTLLQEKGREIGATTGRKRRCGWIDLPQLAYALRINGMTPANSELALTKIDVLDDLPEIPICTEYSGTPRGSGRYPATAQELEQVNPVYKSARGWQTPTQGTTDYNKLPENARTLIYCLETQLDVRITHVSSGPNRKEFMTR